MRFFLGGEEYGGADCLFNLGWRSRIRIGITKWKGAGKRH